MKHAMIDLETLGTDPDSVFLSVAAIQFDPHGNGIGESFYRNIELKSAIQFNRSISADTIKWWLEQRPEIMKKMFISTDTMESVLGSFALWIEDNKITTVWGNSASFDLGMLNNAYKSLGRQSPCHFMRERCYRTLLAEFPIKIDKDETQAHHPVYDCRYQIEKLQSLYRYIASTTIYKSKT
jgi:hypothetical protein